MANIFIRAATLEDTEEMVSVHESAFSDSVFSRRCKPVSDPQTKTDLTEWIEKNISDITLACSTDGQILGWVRWVHWPHRAARGPRPVLTPSMFPSTGDPELAAKFFQTCIDQMEAIMEEKEFWFLSMLVVKKDAQRRGVGSALLRLGLNHADAEGLAGYVNSTIEGKYLYDKFGFVVAKCSSFAPGIKSFHMKRGPQAMPSV